MTNEVNEQIARMNEIATGPLYVASSREQYTNDKLGLTVTMTTTAREGATVEMIRDTKNQFIWAAQMVFQGKHVDATDPDWSARKEYEPAIARHGEPRVVVFGDVRVKRETDIVTISINKFTEYTTAFDMVNHLYVLAECVKLPMNGHASAQQPPAPTPALGSTEAIKQTLGGGSHRAVTTPVSAPVPVSQSDSGTPHFDQFPQNAETRAAFGLEHAGQVVSFTARKVEKKFDANTGEPEWQFFERINHQYPMVRSTLAFIKDEATKAYLPTLPTAIEGEWRVVCYVNKKDTGKVYFNINKVEPVGQQSTPLAPHSVVPDDVDLRAVFPDDPFAGDADLGGMPL